MQSNDSVRITREVPRRRLLLASSSIAAVALILSASPAQAQLLRLRASLGVAPVVVTPRTAATVRPIAMREALARSLEHQVQIGNIRGAVLEAQRAAIASLRSTLLPDVNDGLTKAGDPNDTAGLDPVRDGVFAALDPTGVKTWQGASLPTQTTDKEGKPLVTIVQTDQRAILSWNRFDVGANTTLNFDQKLNGVAQPGWVALNRVGNAVAPSRILGTIKADGTVVVINNRGVIFEKGSQVNLHSLLVSSLEIGNQIVRRQLERGNVDVATTIVDRNLSFLQAGLAPPTTSTLPVKPLSTTLTSTLLTNYGQGVGASGDPLAAAYFTTPLEGTITVDPGARIAAAAGGFIIATAPEIYNGGILTAPEGQVSLQAGRLIEAAISTGSANFDDITSGINPNVRGLVLRSQVGTNGTATENGYGGIVVNAGLIEVPRGYISLGAAERGTVTNSGLLSATTSVARNAKISLTGGTITLTGNADAALASGIIVTPDTNGETVPIGTADTPPAFKATQIEIGNIYLARKTDSNNLIVPSLFGPAAVDFGTNAVLFAPNANVTIGGTYTDSPSDPVLEPPSLGSINIASGAILDVSGVKDYFVDASRNSLLIDPLKRNELRDTPNYREVTTDGAFTLNGARVYVDPRVSGVRDDGVAWVGSPLLEAGSAASQIGVTAAELMTRGGNISMGVAVLNSLAGSRAVTPANAPRINISSGARIDFSGGWTRYGEGFVRSSRLLTSDGRIVNIEDADPNDDFVAIGDGFTEIQSRFGVSRTFANALLSGGRFESAYDEGRDAGLFSLTASTLNLDGAIFGDAFAGGRQVAAAQRPTRASAIVGDTRRLQASASELPSGGLLAIASGYREDSTTYGADILVYNGAGSVPSRPNSEIILSDTKLSGAGLGGLSLFTTGGITFQRDSDVALTTGAATSLLASRTITLDGRFAAPVGSITVETRTNQLGSGFRSDDDILVSYQTLADIPNPYDINVGGTLSVAGLWTNDFGRSSGDATGSAFIDGGSVRLTSAPRALNAGFGSSTPLADYAVDLSGSINIAASALIDVSSGGYVAPDGRLDLSGRGGDVSLINRTVYALAVLTPFVRFGITNTSGTSQSVAFSPAGGAIGQLVPINPDSAVNFSAASLRGFGFEGGGTFTLVAPEIAMGSDVGPGGQGVGLDFLRQTGFGTLDLSANRSRIVRDLFRGVPGGSAFFETSRFRVASGATFDLTQWVRSPLLDTASAARLTAVATGGDISFLTPIIPVDAFDRKAATLRLGGITELDVEAGGTITGAAGAKLAVSKLLNEGTIRIAGGSIIQQFSREQVAIAKDTAFGVRDAAIGGRGLDDVLGGGDGSGTYNEGDLTSAILFSDLANTQRITNGDLFRTPFFDRNVYFLGRLGAEEGIRLSSNSITDLSGTALFDPRPQLLPTGVFQVTGRIVGGGTIEAGGIVRTAPETSSPFPASFVRQALNALPGAVIDLRGTTASFDEAVDAATFLRLPQWSNGGRLSLLSGGTLGGATVRAEGGAPQAEGGVLEWLNPLIRQSDAGVRADNVLFASQLDRAGAGFDTIALYNGFSADGGGGAVDLTVGKGFVVQSLGGGIASLSGGASVTINAPFITLQQTTAQIFSDNRGPVTPTGTGPATLTFNAARNVDLVGNASFALPAADADAVATRSSVNLVSGGDIRLIGLATASTSDVNRPNGLNGSVRANGDINFSAGQVFATTGTGNLQQILEDRRANRAISAKPFDIASSDPNGTIRFLANPAATRSDVYSAGSYVRVRAANIVQNGNLLAPLGLLELGSNFADSTAPATRSLIFANGSTTSVSGAGRLIPYGQTSDLKDYLFTPNSPLPLTAPPVGQLVFSGDTIDIAQGATIDGRGGGDVFAYEFVSGAGGSRDVLDRSNPDIFSGNDGLQYADGRQVYAILPRDKADLIAKFDPVYSADYTGVGNGSLYGTGAGRSVILDAAPGIEAGEYLLLPAHYALLPGLGALRVVENVGTPAPFIGAATSFRDGSVVVGGTYATSGTGLVDSTRRSFTLQSQDVVKRASRLETTFGTPTFVAIADKANLTRPRLPIDAARVILSPLGDLRVAGLLQTSAAAGGRGADVDISAARIDIVQAAPMVSNPGVVTLTTSTLAGLQASSLFIGGERRDNRDGTTTLGIRAGQIDVDGSVSFSVPELVLAVAGQGSTLTIGDGATLTANGVTGSARTGDYVIQSSATSDPSNPFDQSGIGSVLRLASGAERLITREGDPALRNTLRPSTLRIGAATLAGTSLALDTSRTFAISNAANIDANNIAIGGDVIQFGARFIEADVEAMLAAADRLTLRSPDVIRFAATTPHVFKDLRLDAPGLALVAPTGAASRQPSTLSITADELIIGNSSAALGGCTTIGIRACGRVGNDLVLSASTIAFGSGTFKTYGFDGSVTMNATGGMFVQGAGIFETTANAAALTLNTPYLVDRTSATDFGDGYVRPDYQILTGGAFGMTAPAASLALPAASQAPGARIAIGSASAPVSSVTIDGALIRATSGIVDIQSIGSIVLDGAATIAVPGFAKTFGDESERVTVSANAGTINLVSRSGNIDTGAATRLIVDDGTGEAGTLNLFATNGTLNLAALLNPTLAAGVDRTASITIDANAIVTGNGAFDFAAFIAANGRRFGGDFALRTATGNLILNADQSWRARSVSLTADDNAIGQGNIVIAGTIDTSGQSVAGLKLSEPAYTAARVNGGDIALFGNGGVTLASTAVLNTTTSGYAAEDSRVASAGDVTLGTGKATSAADAAAITLAAGSQIDVSALRPGYRLIAQVSKDPATLAEITTYRYAEGDRGGVVSLRALIAPNGTIDVRADGTITGARSTEIEAFRRFDLQAIAATGQFTGLSADGTRLDAAATGAAPNFLADIAPGTLPDFVRNFSVSASNGSNLAGFTVRPGIELTSNADLTLDSILNLGAGQITDYAAAEAAGLLEKSPLGPDANGQPRYQVVANAPGRAFENETKLFNQFVDMTYRVGGSVGGAAPVLTLRATGDLDVKNSITDGFFTFHDRTNADYISYQLGGGDRNFNPAVLLTCGSGVPDCVGGASYTDVVSGTYIDPINGRSTPALANQIRLSLARAQQGEDIAPYVQSPYTASVNGVAALGTGDALGVAELFPLLTSGDAAASSGIRLVGGSGGNSANPLRVDISAPGAVRVSGEHSYDVESVRGSLGLSGPLQLRLPRTGSNDQVEFFDADKFFIEKYGANASAAKDYYTVLTWGNGTTGVAADARASAQSFFAGGDFNGPLGRETGVNARLEDIVAFLAGNNFDGGRTYAENVVAGTSGYAVTPLTRPALDADRRIQAGKIIYTSTTVRTGDGSIALAASGDVNLLRTDRPVFRSFTGVNGLANANNALVGANAVYTAGVRVGTSLPTGITAPQGGNEPLDYLPGRLLQNPATSITQLIASGVTAVAPVFAHDGGSLSIVAGGAVIGRRDVWSNRFGRDARLGQVGLTTEIGMAPEYFTSGVGALAGGDVAIRAGGVIDDLAVSLSNNVFTRDFNNAATLFATGSGNLSMNAGSDLIAGSIALASGVGTIRVGGGAVAGGLLGGPEKLGADGQPVRFLNGVSAAFDRRNLLSVRLTDAVLDLSATGAVEIGGVSAFGADYDLSVNDFGYYTPIAGLNITSGETTSILGTDRSQRFAFTSDAKADAGGVTSNPVILPGVLQVRSITGSVRLGIDRLNAGGIGIRDNFLLYPSVYGQLSALAGGDFVDSSLAMLDADPVDLPGAFSVFQIAPSTNVIVAGLPFRFPFDNPGDSAARLDHNRRLTHAGNDTPARVFVDGSIRNSVLSLAKQGRIAAGGDIIDLTFRGQNLTDRDVTRITAAGDITATQRVVTLNGAAAVGRIYTAANDIALGGPGALFVEAGRDLGPFVISGNGRSGGIRTVGNEANPWLTSNGARLYAMFGLKSPVTGAPSGARYQALRDIYLNPANLAQLDGDLFEQLTDEAGNQTPDRTRYTYAPILAQWLHDNEPALFNDIFNTPAIRDAATLTGGLTLTEATRLAADTTLSDVDRAAAVAKLSAASQLANAAYPRMADLYAALTSLDVGTASDPAGGVLRQRQFLLDKLYFGELAAPADPTGTSYLQYIRAYRAVETLFPAELGYTDNLATYTLDPATISADRPLGVPAKRLDASGEPLAAERVRTGDADLRLSTFQTRRGGDLTIIAPGGNVIAGSVVRLDAQLARTAQAYLLTDSDNSAVNAGARLIDSFTTGNEGILTLRGGAIRSFTDGDFRLNQSRLFAVQGGDLTLFSANGDLNAGQGPKTSSSFPPVTVLCDPNFFCEVDSAGSVAGAGIATFRATPLSPASSVTLVAPVGTVDAGDAGVRASGNVFVAAARVANADNFKVGGTAFGVPSLGVTSAAVPAGAANAIAANTFRPQTLAEKINDRLSQILVNVLGYVGGNDPCPDGQVADENGVCKPPVTP